MKIKDFNSIVGDILNSGQIDPASQAPNVLGESVSNKLDEYAVDIKGVTVPSKFVESIVGKKIEEDTDEDEPENITEAKVTQLVSELANVVSQAKKIIQELTSCGMIGVNTSKPKQKKKVKYGYSQTNKRG